MQTQDWLCGPLPVAQPADACVIRSSVSRNTRTCVDFNGQTSAAEFGIWGLPERKLASSEHGNVIRSYYWELKSARPSLCRLSPSGYRSLYWVAGEKSLSCRTLVDAVESGMTPGAWFGFESSFRGF